MTAKGTPAQKRRLAELIARGCTREEAARALSPPISVRTAYDWLREPAVAAIVKEVRRELLSPFDSVLVDALSATKPGGAPDHKVRLEALKLKLTTPAEDKLEPDEIRYVYDLEDGEPESSTLIIRKRAT